MIPRGSLRGITCRAALTALLVDACLVSFVSLCAFAQQPELDLIADEAAKRIAREVNHGVVPGKVLVKDFIETHGQISQVGSYLADDFSSALSNRLKKKIQVARTRFLQIMERDRIPPDVLSNRKVLDCLVDLGGATIVVDGLLDSGDGSLTLWLRILRAGDQKSLFDERVKIKQSEKTLELLAKPLLLSPVAPISDNVPESGKNGVSTPRCLFCPSLPFTRQATDAKVEGFMLLRVVVADDGSTGQITVLKGLPCGMTAQAIETVRRWKFQPAVGPDGKPTTAFTLIEMTLRLL
jgi:TonB family protein